MYYEKMRLTALIFVRCRALRSKSGGRVPVGIISANCNLREVT